MSGFRIEPTTAATRTKHPRVKEPSHLELIRQLPCVVCLTHPVEAAHIRAPNFRLGKRETGKGEKPSDRWTLPLCQKHHMEQHAMNEMRFYDVKRIDPFATALALWAAEGDLGIMKIIVRLARR